MGEPLRTARYPGSAFRHPRQPWADGWNAVGVRAGSDFRAPERFVTGQNKACHPERSGGGKAGAAQSKDPGGSITCGA